LSTVLVVAGAVGTVVAVVGNLQTAESFIPIVLRPYLTVIPAVIFVLALLASKHHEAPVDGVLYREYLRQRNKLEEVQRDSNLIAAQHSALLATIEANKPRRLDPILMATAAYQLQQDFTADQLRELSVVVYATPTVEDSGALAADVYEMLRWTTVKCSINRDPRDYTRETVVAEMNYLHGVWVVGRGGPLQTAIASWLATANLNVYLDTHPDGDALEIIIGQREEPAFVKLAREDRPQISGDV